MIRTVEPIKMPPYRYQEPERTISGWAVSGHRAICSAQSGDPEKCPVCKTRPPFANPVKDAGSAF